MEENNRLKQLRKKLGFTQKTFSESIGIKQGSYSDIERGKVGISANLMKSLVSKYRINPTWLYDGEGSKFLEEEPNKSLGGIRTVNQQKEECENCEKCLNYEKLIEAHLRTIETQNDYIRSLKEMIKSLQKK